VDEIQRNRSWSSKAAGNNTTFKILDIKKIKKFSYKKVMIAFSFADPDPYVFRPPGVRIQILLSSSKKNLYDFLSLKNEMM
jgi:hypothetical protein